MSNNLVKWDVLNIGYLTRNKFWGEDESRPHRQTLCTSTLLRAGGKNIVVDPCLPPEQMDTLIFNRSGLRCTDIDIVFVSHLHGDHFAGIEAFNRANWLMAEEDLKALRSIEDDKTQHISSSINPASHVLVSGIELMHLPGHTMGLTGLIFKAAEGTVVIAADSVMTRDFFYARQGYFNVVDKKATVDSIDRIGQVADIVIPGHDNYFLVNKNLYNSGR